MRIKNTYGLYSRVGKHPKLTTYKVKATTHKVAFDI
jgi:hypothetical protein